MLQNLKLRTAYCGLGFAAAMVLGFAPIGNRPDLDATVASLLESTERICDLYCFDCTAENQIKTLNDPELEPGGYEFVNPPEQCEIGNCAHGQCDPEFAQNPTHDHEKALVALLDLLEGVSSEEALRLASQHPDRIVLQAERRAVHVLGCNGIVIGYVARRDLDDALFAKSVGD